MGDDQAMRTVRMVTTGSADAVAVQDEGPARDEGPSPVRGELLAGMRPADVARLAVNVLLGDGLDEPTDSGRLATCLKATAAAVVDMQRQLDGLQGTVLFQLQGLAQLMSITSKLGDRVIELATLVTGIDPNAPRLAELPLDDGADDVGSSPGHGAQELPGDCPDRPGVLPIADVDLHGPIAAGVLPAVFDDHRPRPGLGQD